MTAPAGTVAAEIVTWLRLRDGTGDWPDYTAFLARNPDWPAAASLRRQAETRMPKGLPPAVKDKEGWATDIFSAFAALRIVPTPDNICAAVAVIEQECAALIETEPERWLAIGTFGDLFFIDGRDGAVRALPRRTPSDRFITAVRQVGGLRLGFLAGWLGAARMAAQIRDFAVVRLGLKKG